MKKTVGILLVLPFLIWSGFRIYKHITFSIDCGGHMTRAASANSVELAKQEMEVVVKYLESNRMTNGYTSVLYKTPDEDVGFLYRNMTSALDELRKVTNDTTALEKSNLLLKLRESLMHHSGSSTQITVPMGISLFPYNVGWALSFLITLVALVGGINLFILGLDSY